MNATFPLDAACRDAYPVSEDSPVAMGDTDLRERYGGTVDELVERYSWSQWEKGGGFADIRVPRDADAGYIRKRGSFPETYWKGQIVDRYGGNVAPTVMAFDADPLTLRDEPDRYTMLQEHLPRQFDEAYPDVDAQAVIDLAENAAVMDGLGFGMELGGVNRLDHIPEFLTDADRERCYIVDFGFEFGAPERLVGDRTEPKTLAREEAREFLDAADLPLFEERYGEVLGEVADALAITRRPAAPR